MTLPIIITTNEPSAIKKLFIDRIECPMGFDMKLYTNCGKIGVERKRVPGDLLSSLQDGRLRREIIAMRDECDFSIILWHGTIRYDKYGRVLIGRRPIRWTEKGIRNLRRTIEWMEGCYIEEARNSSEMVERLQEIYDYLEDKKHFSLKGRPGLQKEWIVPTKSERVIHFYDGLPGIAPVRAKALWERFPDPIQLYEATVDDLCSIRGFGRPIATDIYDFLRGVK